MAFLNFIYGTEGIKMNTTARFAASKMERTQWFADARYGFFFHYLNPHTITAEHPNQNYPCDINAWNEETDSFNVDLFAEQLAELNAGYAFITVGQNSGYYCSPNQTYDTIMGENRCSRRDLVSDFADALARYNIPCLAYTTGLAPYLDRKAVEKLECIPPWYNLNALAYDRYPDLIHSDPRQVNFQQKWNAMHAEWSARWGRKIRGWWVDGVYPEKMYNFEDEPNGASFARALRAGNPDSIIAYNAGCVVEPAAAYPVEEDYTAGEMDSPEFAIQSGPPEHGLRYHLLSFIGSNWANGKPRFTASEVAAITRKVNDNGGVMTWDVSFSATKGINENALKLLTDSVAEYKRSWTVFPKTSVTIQPPRMMNPEAKTNGKVHVESDSLAGAEIEWNGKKFICSDTNQADFELDPVIPDADLKITRGGLTRTYPVTTVPEFQLSEKSSASYDIYSSSEEKIKLSSLALSASDSKLILDGTVFETEVVTPANVNKLCLSSRCSCAVLFFSFDHVQKSEVYLRPDGHIFKIEGRTVEEIKDVTTNYTPLTNGSYTFHVEIPLAHLPGGKSDAKSFYLNIAQHVTWNGKHIYGMLFGGRNKDRAAHYDSACFKLS